MRTISRVLTISIVSALGLSMFGGAALAAKSKVSLNPILTGYSHPVLVTHAPGDGRTIFIVEQTGRIKRATYQDGAWTKLNTFLDLSGIVSDPTDGGNGERGLLGLAFHPDYEDNGLLYVDYTRAAGGDSVVAEYHSASGATADADSRRVLMVIQQPESNHNGGNLVFGPDRRLYIGSGDGGGSGDPSGNGQRLSTRLGKILRIDPRDPDGSGPKAYAVPRSNPRVGKNGRNDLWAWGLRNPWRFSFDRKNGDLWIGDVGQSAREEIDRSRSNAKGRNAGKGRNFGWSRCEGTRRYPNTGARCTLGTRPIHEYPHGNGRCSVTGGFVHRGPEAPKWRGLYVAADYCGRLFVLNGKGKVRLSLVTPRRVSSFGEDAAGRLFATDVSSGGVYLVRMTGPRP